MGATNVFTGKLTSSSLTISASQNVFRLSCLCKTGNITLLGNVQFSGLSTSTNDFSAGQGFTLTSAGTGQPLDGITIDAPTGGDVAEILLTFNL
jgi:hypothetical protein